MEKKGEVAQAVSIVDDLTPHVGWTDEWMMSSSNSPTSLLILSNSRVGKERIHVSIERKSGEKKRKVKWDKRRGGARPAAFHRTHHLNLSVTPSPSPGELEKIFR